MLAKASREERALEEKSKYLLDDACGAVFLFLVFCAAVLVLEPITMLFDAVPGNVL
jgi:hypothetical protein